MRLFVAYKTPNLKADFFITTEQGGKVNSAATMKENGKAAMINGMNIVSSNNGKGKTYKFDLSGANTPLALSRGFFSRRVEVEVKESSGTLKILGKEEKLPPTTALAKVVEYLGENGVTTLSHQSWQLLQEAGLDAGKPLPLEVWKQRLPSSESLLVLIDDGR
jgi:hypothetical protein